MSQVLSKTKGSIKVVTTLFGTMTPERLEREQKELEHRVEMLTPMTQKEKDEFMEDFDFSEYEENQ